MSRTDFECENTFRRMGQVFNANTPENHPIVFRTEADYKSAMSIIAVSARLFPDVKVYAFQLMSNHVHFVTGGPEGSVRDFFKFFAGHLKKCVGDSVDLSGFTLKLFPVSDCSYFRNAIAYVNRNGFVVNNDVTPFSYPWGTSRYFFQPYYRRLECALETPISVAELRSIVHSRMVDHLKSFKLIDGYITPLDYCHIDEAESVFRDAKHYFYTISKNIELYSEVAKSIGESVYYTDNDLFSVAIRIAKEQCGDHKLKTLPADAKIEIAKRLHFDYNAGDKQLMRLLSLDAMTLKALF